MTVIEESLWRIVMLHRSKANFRKLYRSIDWFDFLFVFASSLLQFVHNLLSQTQIPCDVFDVIVTITWVAIVCKLDVKIIRRI